MCHDVFTFLIKSNRCSWHHSLPGRALLLHCNPKTDVAPTALWLWEKELLSLRGEPRRQPKTLTTWSSWTRISNCRPPPSLCRKIKSYLRWAVLVRFSYLTCFSSTSSAMDPRKIPSPFLLRIQPDISTECSNVVGQHLLFLGTKHGYRLSQVLVRHCAGQGLVRKPEPM